MFQHSETPFDPVTGEVSKTTRWVCDHCQHPIESPDEGILWWAVFREEETNRHDNLSIRHRIGCCPKTIHGRTVLTGKPLGFLEVSLQHLTGHDGLMRLIRLKERGYWTIRQWGRVVERIHCPGFEAIKIDQCIEASDGRFKSCDIGWFATQEYIADKLSEPSAKPKKRKKKLAKLYMMELIRESAADERIAS